MFCSSRGAQLEFEPGARIAAESGVPSYLIEDRSHSTRAGSRVPRPSALPRGFGSGATRRGR